MEFILIRSTAQDLRRFVMYVIKLLQDYYNSNIDITACIRWNNYFKQLMNFQYDVQYVIKSGFQNLVFDTYQDKYIIHINYQKAFNGVNLYQLCSTINNGVISCQQYPIFDDAFKYIRDNISSIYSMYQFMNGG